MTRPDRKRRKPMRLSSHDYARPGAYFVTICLQGRACLLGEIVADEMVLSPAGAMVAAYWRELARKSPTVRLDAFQVMPNHVHFVVWLEEPRVGADLRVRPDVPAATEPGNATDLDRQTVGADLRARPDELAKTNLETATSLDIAAESTNRPVSATLETGHARPVSSSETGRTRRSALTAGDG